MKFKELCDALIASGIWESTSDEKYSFYISPDVFELKNYINQFELIGELVTSFYKDIFAVSQNQFKINSKDTDYLNLILQKGKDGYPFICDYRLPPIIKVDIIIDIFDTAKIVEIDGYNPRGIPYAILLNEIYNVKNERIQLSILKELDERKVDKLLWIYADRERYYLRSFNYLSNIFLKNYNISVSPLNANDASLKILENDTILIAPWGLSKSNELIIKRQLIDLYNKKNKNFIYPLKPWLNNKLLLAIPFSQDHKKINSILKEFYPKLKEIKKHLPFTEIIDRNFKHISHEKKFIIKEGVSSGHKGVYFQNSHHFNSVLHFAKMQKKPTYILQEEVPQRTFNMHYYNNHNTIHSDDFFCRFIAHYNLNGELLNVDLTARKSPMVYGSVDSVQTTCVW